MKQNIGTKISKENSEFILSRLRLAQAILEESDLLAGKPEYDFDREKWWLHPRHEREALTVYLLLTCLDRLGQEKKFITLTDWLKSKKDHHKAERNEIIKKNPETTDPVDVACALADHYQSLYGVRNSFYQGINNLSEEGQRKLLSSINLSFNPDFGKFGPNTSTPSFPLEDPNLERNLKLKYLYDKRNRFTHRLEQYHSSSMPSYTNENEAKIGPSWVASIIDDKLNYFGTHRENALLKSGGAYIYSITDWPFVLFETLHEAIGSQFDRTSIKLNFTIMIFSIKEPKDVRHLYNISHDRLKNFKQLVSRGEN